jgi:hypothetical protein
MTISTLEFADIVWYNQIASEQTHEIVGGVTLKNWSEVKRSQFMKDFKTLLDTYGVAYIVDLTVQNYDKFDILDGYMYTYTDKASDGKAAEEVIHKVLIDKALDDGDKEMFERLTTKTCVDCDVKLECHRIGHGRCAECEFPNARRYI